MLKVPVLGDVLRKSAVSRFTRTLGTLICSGVSILDGLEITAKTAGNRVIQDAIMESRASIAGGDTIAAPLQKSDVFPPMVISMIAVGEQTGGLDEMLSKIADFYDEEVDAAVSGLLSLARADHDRVPRRRCRRHGRRHVPADLRHDQRGAVRGICSPLLWSGNVSRNLSAGCLVILGTPFRNTRQRAIADGLEGGGPASVGPPPFIHPVRQLGPGCPTNLELPLRPYGTNLVQLKE